ncbi:MAG: hypothetical protein KAX45_02685 [Chitinophagaceae bacterium]|nr:hypothetical protein [Chitinophagaceae bacterium]MBP8243423.1 hypothetical protein [Chitinophagaceae bacterium]
MRPSVKTTITLERIKCYDEGDGWGSAEPYLWTIFYKVDGSTVRLASNGRLQGTGSFRFHQTSHNNLPNQDMDAGEIVSIPAVIGKWETTLVPIPIDNSLKAIIKQQTGWDDIPAITGCVYVMLEEDWLTNNSAEAGHRKVNEIFQQEVNTLIPTLGILNQTVPPEFMRIVQQKMGTAVKNAIKKSELTLKSFWRLANPDDMVGAGTQQFSHDELGHNQTKQFSTRWNNEGSWELFGKIHSTHLPQLLVTSVIPPTA